MENSTTIYTFHDTHRRWTIHRGDVQHVLPTLSSNLYDGVVTDAPYGIDFMGHGWDSEVPPVAVWQAILRACKPGAYLLAFGGPKTFHRLACNLEDAGWHHRDTLSWLYAEGFPKGLNFGKAIPPDNVTTWDGYSTALCPAWEPILLVQKPCRDNFVVNALRFGCGGLNIKGCRIGSYGGTKRSHQAPYPRQQDGREDRQHWGRTGHHAEPINQGRWAKNVIIDEAVAAQVDLQSGKSRSQSAVYRHIKSDIGNGITLRRWASRFDTSGGYDDEGGASRFFYIAKANRKERKGNDHPTVKPMTLCEYLARLIVPPERKTPRRLIVPFSGSGSEMLGALMAGWDHVTGIEREPHYVEIARRRLADFAKGSAMPA